MNEFPPLAFFDADAVSALVNMPSELVEETMANKFMVDHLGLYVMKCCEHNVLCRDAFALLKAVTKRYLLRLELCSSKQC